MNIVGWAESHPLTTGLIVFGGGLAVLFLLGNSSGGSSDSGQAAYFAAESQQAQAGDALQAVQVEAQASTTQTLINDTAAQNIQTTWANADVTDTANNNATAIAVAPFQTAVSVGQDLATAASAPPLVTTSTTQNKSNGIFGIFGSSKNTTTTSQQANPAAIAAANDLTGLLGNLGFAATS